LQENVLDAKALKKEYLALDISKVKLVIGDVYKKVKIFL
jgi:hypothetical protein